MRRASDRLGQAEALWAIRDRASFPAGDFTAAWREVVLWDEHTWGAAGSVDTPDAPEVLAQWAYKRAFALRADTLSRWLLARSLELPLDGGRGARDSAVVADAFDVANTASWARTEVVYVPAELSRAGDRVLGPDGRPVSSQRLSRGQLAVLVRDLPPLSQRRYTVRRGSAWAGDAPAATAGGAILENDRLRVAVDTLTGAIASVVWKPRGAELVDRSARHGLGEYLYVAGTDSARAAGVSSVRVEVREPGPLVASLAVWATAPGARALLREVGVVQGADRVDLSAVVDKLPVREKEAVHFAFPFLVPGGQVRFDVASGIVRPDSEQLSGSVRNFVDVQSWADVSNDSLGVTWATPSAPLVEVGGIFAELPWMRSIPPDADAAVVRDEQLLAHQLQGGSGRAGGVRLRAAAARSLPPRRGGAVRGRTARPLVVAPARGRRRRRRCSPSRPPRRPAAAAGAGAPEPVVATSVRPTADGRGWLIALYNPTAEAARGPLRLAPRRAGAAPAQRQRRRGRSAARRGRSRWRRTRPRSSGWIRDARRRRAALWRGRRSRASSPSWACASWGSSRSWRGTS